MRLDLFHTAVALDMLGMPIITTTGGHNEDYNVIMRHDDENFDGAIHVTGIRFPYGLHANIYVRDQKDTLVDVYPFDTNEPFTVQMLGISDFLELIFDI